MYFLYRDQKTIDIENRANYVALKKRWGVLDVTIQIPEDEMLKSVPAYMEGSEDEEDCKLIPSTVDTQETVDSSSASSDTRDSSTSQDQPKDCQPPVSACSHQTCTNSTNCDSRDCSQGESTDSALSGTQCAFSVPVSASKCGSESDPSQAGRSTSTDHTTEICKHLNGRIASTSSFQSDESEGRTKCRCNFRRNSGSDVLDDEGQALFNILEFSSKVHVHGCRFYNDYYDLYMYISLISSLPSLWGEATCTFI